MNQPAPALPSTIHALRRRADNRQFAAIEADLMPTLVALRKDRTTTTFVGRKGDLTCWLTHVDLPARKSEPAMLLAATTDPANRHVYILLSELWVVLEHTRNVKLIQRLTARLYGFPTKQDEFRVLDALFDFAEDLKNAKPPPGFDSAAWLQALAEDDMILNVNGQARNG